MNCIFQLRPIGDDYFKCLAMYDRDPQLVLNSGTMENMVVGQEKSLSMLVMYVIQQISSGEHLDHRSLFPVSFEIQEVSPKFSTA